MGNGHLPIKVKLRFCEINGNFRFQSQLISHTSQAKKFQNLGQLHTKIKNQIMKGTGLQTGHKLWFLGSCPLK